MNYKKHEHPTEYKRTYIPYVKAIKYHIPSDNIFLWLGWNPVIIGFIHKI